MARQVLTLPDTPGILLTQDEGDARYVRQSLLRVDPDPYPQYLPRAEAFFMPLTGAYTKEEADQRYARLGAEALPVALAPAPGPLAWTVQGLSSDAPSRAEYDALVARCAALEAQVVALQTATLNLDRHYHPLATWRQTGAMVVPQTVLEEVPA